MIAYPITLTPDDNGTLFVTCPDLPEVKSFGDDHADALSHAADAVAEAIAARLHAFEDIPRPSVASPSVTLDTQLALKVMLRWAMSEAAINRAELGRRLGVHRPQIDRLFDAGHATRLDQYDAAFRVLGKAVEVGVRDAA